MSFTLQVLMSLFCPRCTQDVEKQGSSPKQAVASCRACGRLFSVVREPAETTQPHESLPKPREVREHRAPHRLWLSYRWFSLKKAIVGSFVTAMAAGMTAGAVYVGQIESGWLLHASPLLLGPVTLLVGYRTLADLVNRTTIEWTANRLRVRHGPVHFGSNRNRDLDPTRIDQLFCRRCWVSGDKNHSGYWRYDLVVVVRDGDPITLICGDRIERLVYIEQQLEQALGVVGCQEIR